MAKQKEYSPLVVFMVEVAQEKEDYDEATQIEEDLNSLAVRRYKTPALQGLYDRYNEVLVKIKRGIPESKIGSIWKELKVVYLENDERLYLGDEEYEAKYLGVGAKEEHSENSSEGTEESFPPEESEGFSLSSSPEPSDTEEGERLKNLEPHPASELFPMMTREVFEELKVDIYENGQYVDILLYEGKILDGRNRYRACIELGRTPKVKDCNCKDPVAFVVSMNAKRRDLNDGQRAIIAAKMSNMKQGNFSKTKDRSYRSFGEPEISIPIAAKMLGVSKDSVERSRKILKTESTELISAVESGVVTIALAAEIARVPNEHHEELFALNSPGDVRSRIEEILNPRQTVQPQEVAPKIDDKIPAREEPKESQAVVTPPTQHTRQEDMENEKPKTTIKPRVTKPSNPQPAKPPVEPEETAEDKIRKEMICRADDLSDYLDIYEDIERTDEVNSSFEHLISRLRV